MKRTLGIILVVLLGTSLAWSLLRASREHPAPQSQQTTSTIPAIISKGTSGAGSSNDDDAVVPLPSSVGGPAKAPEGVWLDQTGRSEEAPPRSVAEPTVIPFATSSAPVIPTGAPTATAVGEAPEVSALRELQQQGPPGSSLLGGIKSSRPLSTGGSPVLATATPILSPTATPSLPRVGGQATGYTMLYLMHPKARVTVERQIEALLEANLDEVYLGALVDGTFSVDFPYLESVVRRLASDGRALTLVLYFSNGSAMRDYDRTSSKVSFNLAPPDAFRALIQDDSATRAEFQAIVSRAIPIFDLNRSLGPRNTNIAIPMLEDNLDRASYQEMRDLMRTVLGSRATIVRNPCPGCAPGNDSETLGDPLESHNPAGVNALTVRDGFSLDGTGYELPGDAPGEQPSLESIRQLKAFSVAHGIRYFGLWRKQRQGLGSTLINPDDRNYEVPSDEQIDTEVQLLRWGLETLEPTPEPTATEEADGFFR